MFYQSLRSFGTKLLIEIMYLIQPLFILITWHELFVHCYTYTPSPYPYPLLPLLRTHIHSYIIHHSTRTSVHKVLWWDMFTLQLFANIHPSNSIYIYYTSRAPELWLRKIRTSKTCICGRRVMRYLTSAVFSISHALHFSPYWFFQQVALNQSDRLYVH